MLLRERISTILISVIVLLGIWIGTFKIVFLFFNDFYTLWNAGEEHTSPYFLSEYLLSKHLEVVSFLTHELSNVSYAFTAEEQKHLFSVRSLIDGTSLIFYSVITILIIVFSFFFKKKKFSQIIASLFLSTRLTLITVAFFLVIALFGFSSFFLKWHSIAFQDTYWLFPESSLLISLYPETLFQFLFFVWLIFILVYCIVVMLFMKFFSISLIYKLK